MVAYGLGFDDGLGTEPDRQPVRQIPQRLGIVRLADKYDEDRLEAACRRALAYSSVSYKSVKSILEKGLDRIEEEEESTAPPVKHRNIRGQSAYARGGRSC